MMQGRVHVVFGSVTVQHTHYHSSLMSRLTCIPNMAYGIHIGFLGQLDTFPGVLWQPKPANFQCKSSVFVPKVFRDRREIEDSS